MKILLKLKLSEYLQYLRFNLQNKLVQRDRGVQRGRTGVNPLKAPQINLIYAFQNSAPNPLGPHLRTNFFVHPCFRDNYAFTYFSNNDKLYLRERDENKLCTRIQCNCDVSRWINLQYNIYTILLKKRLHVYINLTYLNIKIKKIEISFLFS